MTPETINSSELFEVLLSRLVKNWHGLPDKPNENPFTTLRALWRHVARSYNQPAGDTDKFVLDDASIDLLCNLVERRIAGTPLAYLIGHQTFMGIEFLATPEAMIPRKETELLAQTALDLVHTLVAERGVVCGLDLCTGCGNIALALAHYVNEYQAVASDISPDAIGLAKRNAALLGLTERVTFCTGDLFEPIHQAEYLHHFDLITCNPPYISTVNAEKMDVEIAEYEPRAAFDGGPFGVNFIMRLIREVPQYLKPASWLAFEVGLGQGNSVQRILEKSADFQKAENRVDEAGIIRVLLAQSC
jgi:release factor glutamine methyltransferase